MLVLVASISLGAASVRAASRLYIRGGGDGHGIGMSQYGAYGYALHGLGYPAILARYYTGTALGQVNPARVVRVLLATGTASFAGATAAVTSAAGPVTLRARAPTRWRLPPEGGCRSSAPAGFRLALRSPPR